MIDTHTHIRTEEYHFTAKKSDCSLSFFEVMVNFNEEYSLDNSLEIYIRDKF